MIWIFVLLGVLIGLKLVLDEWVFKKGRERRKQHYLQNVLTSDLWQRKRWLVLKRDGNRCVHCGAKATEVHHKKYARVNIGREPIEWLESVCPKCHKNRHGAEG